MKSLRIKVFVGVLCGLLLVAAVGEFLLYRQATSHSERELFSSLQKYAAGLSEVGYVNTYDVFTLYPDWQNRLRVSPEDHAQFFEIITADGFHITDSHNLGGESLPEVGHHQGRKIIDYGNVVLGVYEHHFEATSDDQKTQHLKLIVAENTDLLRSARLSTIKTLLFFTPLAVVAAFLISLALTTAILSSISRFTKRVQSYSRTDSESRLDLDNIDKEMQPLGNALNKYIYELNKHSNLESKLLADTAHELRVPLDTMRKELDQVKLANHSPAERSMHAEKLDNTLSGLQVMADNMLMLYRVESGNYQPRMEPIELCARVERIVRPLRKNNNLEIEISGPEVTLTSSRSVVNLIISRLLANAIQHAPGTSISINWEATDESVNLHVDDAGAGVPESDRERIFDRHYRFQDQKQSVTSGTGLGLALVRLYANSVNAQTLCTDSPLGGARFTVVFPLVPSVRAKLPAKKSNTSNLQGVTN